MNQRNLDDLIINIVQTQIIHEQHELQQVLQQHGYDVPQATLSRRLNKLQIAKVAGIYKLVGIEQPRSLPIILNIQISDTGLIVLLTHPGQANILAYYFDQNYVNYHRQPAQSNDLLGTIAGDDTVLLITKNKQSVQSIIALLEEKFPYLGPILA